MGTTKPMYECTIGTDSDDTVNVTVGSWKGKIEACSWEQEQLSPRHGAPQTAPGSPPVFGYLIDLKGRWNRMTYRITFHFVRGKNGLWSTSTPKKIRDIRFYRWNMETDSPARDFRSITDSAHEEFRRVERILSGNIGRWHGSEASKALFAHERDNIARRARNHESECREAAETWAQYAQEIQKEQ